MDINEIQKKCETVDLIEEMLTAGMRVEIETHAGKFFAYGKVEHAPEEFVQELEHGHGTSLLDAMRELVDIYRDANNKESRADELQRELQATLKHGETPLVEIGPNAACACGSVAPLVVHRNEPYRCDWKTGKLTRLRDGVRFLQATPGEIGSCPDCHQHYNLKQS